MQREQSNNTRKFTNLDKFVILLRKKVWCNCTCLNELRVHSMCPYPSIKHGCWAFDITVTSIRCNSMGIKYQLLSQVAPSNTSNCCDNCSQNSLTQKMMMNDHMMATIGGISSTRLASDFASITKKLFGKMNKFDFLFYAEWNSTFTYKLWYSYKHWAWNAQQCVCEYNQNEKFESFIESAHESGKKTILDF